MTTRVEPFSAVQIDLDLRRVLLWASAPLAVGVGVVIALSSWNLRVTEQRLRAAALCQGVAYEELVLSAAELASTSGVSRSDAARMLKHVACPPAKP